MHQHFLVKYVISDAHNVELQEQTALYAQILLVLITTFYRKVAQLFVPTLVTMQPMALKHANLVMQVVRPVSVLD